jgi:hypothetical protein
MSYIEFTRTTEAQQEIYQKNHQKQLEKQRNMAVKRGVITGVAICVLGTVLLIAEALLMSGNSFTAVYFSTFAVWELSVVASAAYVLHAMFNSKGEIQKKQEITIELDTPSPKRSKAPR